MLAARCHTGGHLSHCQAQLGTASLHSKGYAFYTVPGWCGSTASTWWVGGVVDALVDAATDKSSIHKALQLLGLALLS